jgi:hypothetical protein
LEELGVDKKRSARAKKLNDIPEDQLDAYVGEMMAAQKATVGMARGGQPYARRAGLDDAQRGDLGWIRL